jgi:hypothetical protein
MFTGVVTTARRYVGDTTTKGGLLLDTTKMEGTMNPFQWVVSVGPMVKDLKEGDIVSINFKRYAKAQHLPGAIENNVQSDNLSVVYDIPMINIDGVEYLYLQNNDIEFVVEEYDGIDEGGLLQ